MIKMLKKLRNEDGFTLLEMAIVILIIAALLLIIIPNISGVTENVDKTTGDALKNTVETQKVIYEIETGNEPESLSDLVPKYISDEQLKAYNESGSGD